MVYFMKANKRAIETGKVIEVKDPSNVVELNIKPYADASDETLSDLLDGRKTPWYSFLKEVSKMETEGFCSYQ